MGLNDKSIKRPKSCASIVVAMLIGSFILFNQVHSSIKSNLLFIYFGKPMLWILVSYIVFRLPKSKSNAKLRFKETLLWITILISAGYVTVMMLGGFVVGMGKSPFDHSLKGIFLNFIQIASLLIAREMMRSYIINGMSKKWYYFKIVLVVLLMTATGINIDSLDKLDTKLSILKFVGGTILPDLSDNILAAYLVYLRGPLLSIIYLGFQQGLFWYSPILPNFNWIGKALIGILYPMFSMMFLQYYYSYYLKKDKVKDTKKENPLGWIIATISSIMLIWFAVGVFPMQPFVIITGSMEPVIYPGDVVIVNKIEVESLKKGDIIQYKKDNIFVFHRIIDIVQKERVTKYKTKGDNNSGPDSDLVEAQNIKGKIVYIVPKLGWPTLLLRGKDSVDTKQLEF